MERPAFFWKDDKKCLRFPLISIVFFFAIMELYTRHNDTINIPDAGRRSSEGTPQRRPVALENRRNPFILQV